MKKFIRPIGRQCEGCLRIERRELRYRGELKSTRSRCHGWSDPEYMWRKHGTCPHVLTDAEEAERVYG